jgi:hypothetical protein
MNEKKSLLLFSCVVILLLAITVPLQYLVRREVVVGLPSEGAHAHAHAGEDQGQEEGESAHEHTHEENHVGAEVTLGINLISNYGFEVGTREQIWGWSRLGMEQGAVVYRDIDTSYMGFSSAAVNTNGVFAKDAGWYMKLQELPRNHDVFFEGFVKTMGLQGGAYLRVLAQGIAEGEEEPHLLVSASNDGAHGDSDWTRYSLQCFIPPEATGVWLEVGVSGKGQAWFDELSLVVEEREDKLATGENLLLNPSLDDGARYWHYSGNTPDPRIAYSVSPTAPDGGQAFLFQDLTPVTAQESYSVLYQSICGFYGHKGTLIVSGVIRARDLDGVGSMGASVFKDSGIDGYRSMVEVSGNSAWTEFNMAIPITDDVDSVWIRINLEGSGGLEVYDLNATFQEGLAIEQ